MKKSDKKFGEELPKRLSSHDCTRSNPDIPCCLRCKRRATKKKRSDKYKDKR